MLYIDSKRITQKIISKKIMYELQYNNILWKWGKILEAKTEKRTNFKGKCSKESKKKKKTEVQHWQSLLVHLAQVTQSFFFASLWIFL